MTLEISQYFEELYKQVEMPMHEDLSMLENKVMRLENKLKEIKEMNNRKAPGTGKNPTGNSSTGRSDAGGNGSGPTPTSGSNMDKPMSFQEKKALTMMIKSIFSNL